MFHLIELINVLFCCKIDWGEPYLPFSAANFKLLLDRAINISSNFPLDLVNWPGMLDSGWVQSQAIEERQMLQESRNTSGVDTPDGHSIRVAPESDDVVANPFQRCQNKIVQWKILMTYTVLSFGWCDQIDPDWLSPK
jgi:hypothetical protein